MHGPPAPLVPPPDVSRSALSLWILEVAPYILWVGARLSTFRPRSGRLIRRPRR